MATVETLQAEAHERPRMALVAAAAALLTLLAPLIGVVVLSDEPDNLPAAALYRHEQQTGLLLSAACSVLGLIAIAFVLDFLFRALRARDVEMPPLLRLLPWIGALGLGGLTLAVQVMSVVKLGHFATDGTQTYEEAKAAVDYGALGLVGIAAQLAFGFALVMLSINAMRAGLLTRFLGYLGVISAVLFLIPLVPLPIVQIYWLGALALLFAGRLPSGMPPAWQSGEAMPWPSAAEMREARVRAADARRSGGALDEAPAASSGAGPSPATLRRKRKRRG
jgi:hypothetical protein